MMKKILLLPLLLLSMVTIGRADLLLYEPFDYQTYNHETMGRLEGRNGGLGFAGPWKDVGGENGYAFIYDQRGNPEDLYDGGWGENDPGWDGVVDNIPTLGGYVGMSDWDRTGGIHSSRKLAESAGALARKNGGVLWMSAVWHLPNQSFFAPVGLALASKGGGFKERAVAINDQGDAIGVGNGRNFRKMEKLNPVIWNNGEEAAGQAGTKVDGKKDAVVIIKYEFGETDTVSTWYFSEDQELTEEVFNQNAISCSGSIDEDALEYLTFATILRSNAIDEIRLGTDFESVISGSIPPRQEVKIIRDIYNQQDDHYYLEWTSNPGEVYGLYVAEDMGGYKPCVAAAVEASQDKKTTTFGPFPNPIQGRADLKFEIGLPDLTPPAIERVWGSGTSISLVFSESMLPTTSLVAANYQIEADGGGEVPVQSAEFNEANGTITLTTGEPLKPDTSYTITTSNLTDLANLPVADPEATLRTWDDDPDGVKVFILAGQSNMVGYGHTETGQHGDGGLGTLRYLAVNNAEFPEYDYASLLVDPTKPETSEWKTRENVKLWWRNGANAKYGGPIFKGDLGPLTSNGRWFGPEFGFGQVIGDYYKDRDVLIIKPAWGGHNLVDQFRSPSAVAKRGGAIGRSYIEMFENAREVLSKLGEEFPEWKGRGYQIVGFGWHQGTSDKAPDKVAEEYKYNLPDFIHSVRDEFGKPELPFVIATTGMGQEAESKSSPPYESYHPVERAQLWVAGVEKPAQVLTDDTRGYNEKPEVSPRNQGHHWHGSARSYFRIGKGLGEAMVRLLSQ
jgi:hypothetical protein